MKTNRGGPLKVHFLSFFFGPMGGYSTPWLRYYQYSFLVASIAPQVDRH